MKVYKAISGVSKKLAEAGISKDRQNTKQGYSFRGIDDVYNALASALVECGLCILPKVLSRTVAERATQRGGLLFYVIVEVEYALVAVEDGSTHVVKTFGEAMDSGDKATNKAMSAAYKYMAIQTFAIPTEGDNDADATTHEISTDADSHDNSVPEFTNSQEKQAQEVPLKPGRMGAIAARNDRQTQLNKMATALISWAKYGVPPNAYADVQNLSAADKHNVWNMLTTEQQQPVTAKAKEQK